MRKITSATARPSEGFAMEYDVGKSGVSKIKLARDGLGGENGARTVFEDGSERIYRNMSFRCDYGKTGKEKGPA